MPLFISLVSVVSIPLTVICTIILIVDAFRNETWKGFAGLFCCFYLLYFGIFEFQSNMKMLILLGAFGIPLIAGIFFGASGYGHSMHLTP